MNFLDGSTDSSATRGEQANIRPEIDSDTPFDLSVSQRTPYDPLAQSTRRMQYSSQPSAESFKPDSSMGSVTWDGCSRLTLNLDIEGSLQDSNPLCINAHFLGAFSLWGKCMPKFPRKGRSYSAVHETAGRLIKLVSRTMCETLSEYISTTMTSLLTQLKSDPDTESVLLRNQDLIADYPNIAGLYYQWGFSPNRRIFTASLERDEVMAALSNEMQVKENFDDLDMRKDEEWDVHRPMKWEVERTYRTESLAQLADLHEMGMGNNLEMMNDFPSFPDDIEDPELTTMWCQDPYSTPRTAHQSHPDFTTPRSSRGLKKLSVKVKELVSDKCITTYKEVADELIRSLEDEDEKRREEKNIRRRVYDALNVLSAAGVITKKGKQVTWIGRCSNSPFSSECSEELRERIDQKTQMLKELAAKNQALKALIDRNQKRPQRDRLGFPLLVIATKQSQKNQVQNS